MDGRTAAACSESVCGLFGCATRKDAFFDGIVVIVNF